MKEVYLIGNGHLDPVWLWQWQEGYTEVKATFKSALDRMREFPDFKFTSACAAYYMWIEQSDKEMFEEIKQRVKEGRWCIAGGWFIQPDCNLPSGESFARHALISQRYFKEKFGVTAKTGYNVDSFGHNGNLPQILRKSGMENYVFMRPKPYEKELPAYLFDWESRDGSRVRTFRIPESYSFGLDSFELFEKVRVLADKTEMMAFFGVGNHGGGATRELLSRMKKELSGDYVYKTPDEYFEKVKEYAVPVVRDDLQYHAKGCYSAMSQTKINNRRSENMLFETEAFSVLSERTAGTEYPAKELERAWKNVLFNQFHDLLGGCSIREVYDDAAMFYGESMAIAERNTNFALQQISWNIDTMQSSEPEVFKRSWPPAPSWKTAEDIGTPVVIFNPNAFEADAVVSVRETPKSMTDASGAPVAIQQVRDSKTNKEFKYKTAFRAKVPPLGWTVYKMFFEKENVPAASSLSAEEDRLENSLVRVDFDKRTGEIKSITDKRTGRKTLAGTATVLTDETECDTWAHDVRSFDKDVARCEKGTLKVIEKGPVVVTVRSEQEIGESTLVRDYSLFENSDEVRVRAKVYFREKHRMLKLSFDCGERDARALCGIPFGFIERAADGSEQAAIRWTAICSEKGGAGVVSDAFHSFDAEKGVLSVTPLRGAIFADHFGERDSLCEFMEQGEHIFTYGIFPFTDPADAAQSSKKLVLPPVAIPETFHKGALGTEFSALSISNKNVIVTAVKKSADGKGTVIRAYEGNGRAEKCSFALFGTKWNADFGPNEIKTFMISEKGVRETDLTELA